MRSPTDRVADRPLHVLREYSVIADGERGALIGPRGDLAWMCAPRWDSGAVFAGLLGGRGEYALSPATTRFTWGGYYEEGSLIWRSRWITPAGVIECREALAFPGDPHVAIVLRSVRAVDTDARIDVALSVGADFGEHPMHQVADEDGVRTLRAGALHVRWSGADGAHYRDGRLRTVLALAAGQRHELVLELSDRPLPADVPSATRLWERTEQAWRRAVPAMTGTLADRDARHAYAVLRGLTSSSGGMVAAATAALPERAEQGRNYDYRYCWIRDQCYAGQAVSAAGPHPLLDDAVTFVSERLLDDGPGLKPAYTAGGGRVPDESSLDLPGYPGARARIGNRVNEQFQLDVFGEALLLFAAADRHDRLDRDHWKAAETAAAAIATRWPEPDAGIWELHDARWAHSRLICAAGLRALGKRAPPTQSQEWNALADTLVADTATDCLHPSGRWQRAPGDQRVDAALLLPTIRGAVPADNSHALATLDAVRTELGREGYVYRFRHDERPLAEAEGAFLLCGFVMALAEHQQGHVTAAARRFERSRAACGSPGLFTEEFDIVERQLRGNLPQAFVHAVLLESAHRLAVPSANQR